VCHLSCRVFSVPYITSFCRTHRLLRVHTVQDRTVLCTV
jgi:hypothetical protein